MKQNTITLAAAILALAAGSTIDATACTGITLKTSDGATVTSRTIEWGGSYLNSLYVIVPRGYVESSLLPPGHTDGMKYTAKYGYVGLAVEQKDFIAEGLNEKGLSAGLYYFPGYGEYPAFNPAEKHRTLSDMQIVSYTLARCSTVDEVKSELERLSITNIDPRASTLHWRFTDATGKQLVLEIIDSKMVWYDNPLGVITNSPSFDWQITNLNNYINLYPGGVDSHEQGPIRLSAFGAGSGFLGIPGDITPPSRFVRAAFYSTTAPTPATTFDAVISSFHILNNFDIPIGIEFPSDQIPEGVPSATQWTSVSDICNLTIYYRTMFNSTIRSIDLRSIDFANIAYQFHPLDPTLTEPIQNIIIK